MECITLLFAIVILSSIGIVGAFYARYRFMKLEGFIGSVCEKEKNKLVRYKEEGRISPAIYEDLINDWLEIKIHIREEVEFLK